MFRKFSSRHQSTLLCSNVVKFGQREIGEIVHYLPDKNSPAFQTVATLRIAPKICQDQPPTMYSECSRFHPNRFTFGGVIAECVNTAKSPLEVNPILGLSLSSSRIINVKVHKQRRIIAKPAGYANNLAGDKHPI